MKEYKPTLKLVKGKWYVGMTVPEEVRHILGEQIRLSTGTSDRNEAQKRLPEIAIELKQKILKAKDQFDAEALGEEVLSIAARLNRQVAVDMAQLDKTALIALLHSLTSAQNADEVSVGRFSVSKIKRHLEENSRAVNRVDAKTRREEISKARRILTKLEGATNTFKQAADEWLEKNKWNREKSRNVYISHINRFIGIVGDVEVTSITPVMLYDFAEHMALEYESSYATIVNYMASIKSVLKYAIRQGLIKANPANDLDLKPFGVGKKKRKPFTQKMLKELFLQDLPDEIRLLWSILISTGMRLDEAALLTVTNIKEEQGIRFFDLTEAVVKNEGSVRKVPVPSCIEQMIDDWVGDLGYGRLFKFPVNADGKAQNSASKKSMYYIRKITDDKALVTHSFRHTFKDLCRNASISKDLHDFITGHSGGDSASNYGEGHSLKIRKEALDLIEHPYL